jgi:hypothetical protein
LWEDALTVAARCAFVFAIGAQVLDRDRFFYVVRALSLTAISNKSKTPKEYPSAFASTLSIVLDSLQ